MQTRLQQRWGVWGIVVAAAAFGAMHWDVVHSPIAFCEGLLLGAVARRSGSILPGVGAHAIQNLASVSLGPWIVQASGGSRGYVLLALSVTGLGASGFALHRIQPPSRDAIR